MPLIAIIAILILGLSAKRPLHPDAADSQQYLRAAYHIANHGTFSESGDAGPAPAGLGREPGYGLFLAALMKMDSAFGRFTPACRPAETDCRSLYVVPQWANVVLLSASAALLFFTAQMLFGSLTAAWIAGLHIWLNQESHETLFYVVSDYLAMFLLSVAGFMAVLAWRHRRPIAWIIPSLALAALTLTKAVFLYYALVLFLAVLCAGCCRRRYRKRILASLAIAVVAFAVPVSGWMARNLVVGDTFSLPVLRSGLALSSREVFNHMTPSQYAAAFVYWTRGFGDGLAKEIFEKETWQPFELDRPDGYYLRSIKSYDKRVDRIAQSTGQIALAAQKTADKELIYAILTSPLTHIATTLPVFYRGIWIDEFIVVSLPALIWLCLYAIRRRQWLWLLILSSGPFSMLFYALISLNVPRYQLTALPALGLALGFAMSQVRAIWLRRKEALKSEKPVVLSQCSS